MCSLLNVGIREEGFLNLVWDNVFPWSKRGDTGQLLVHYISINIRKNRRTVFDSPFSPKLLCSPAGKVI